MSLNRLTSDMFQLHLDHVNGNYIAPTLFRGANRNILDIENNNYEPELEFDEPKYHCLVCDKQIPVLLSKTHRRECFDSPDNDTCPFCNRRRRDYIMEAHIRECGQRRRVPNDKTERAVANYRCCTEVVERVIVGKRDSIINGYKRALHLGTECPYQPCYICKTYEQHKDGLCLRILGGTYFKELANREYDDKLLPKVEDLLKTLKDQRQIIFMAKLERKWERLNPGVPLDMELINELLEKHSRRCDRSNAKVKEEKLIEVKRLIDRHTKVLGNKLTWQRDYFIMFCSDVN